MKTYPPHIEELRTAWKASGLRQPEFAQRCGVTYGMMVQLLTGGTYSLPQLNKARAAVGLPAFAWPKENNLPPGFKYGVGVHAGLEMKDGPSSRVPAVIVPAVAQPLDSKPCIVCRTPTFRSYRSGHDREFLCSPECIELRAEMVAAAEPAAPSKSTGDAAQRTRLDAHLAAALAEVTTVRAAMNHTPLERRLTQALTLISGVRFDLKQEGL